MKRLEKTVHIGHDDNGEMQMYTFPAKYEVCHRCEGHGKHVNPDIECEGGGFTGSEWAEACAEDPDFHDDYFGGMYDISCTCCEGNRVVLVIDESSFDKEDKIAFSQYQDQLEKDQLFEEERAAERRMGC